MQQLGPLQKKITAQIIVLQTIYLFETNGGFAADPEPKHTNSTNSFNASFYLMASEAEVSRVLTSISDQASSGIDGFPCLLIRYVSSFLVERLVHLINRYFAEGIFPIA